jgi:hypothetical protein
VGISARSAILNVIGDQSSLEIAASACSRKPPRNDNTDNWVVFGPRTQAEGERKSALFYPFPFPWFFLDLLLAAFHLNHEVFEAVPYRQPALRSLALMGSGQELVSFMKPVLPPECWGHGELRTGEKITACHRLACA